jgi:hypothetical protein
MVNKSKTVYLTPDILKDHWNISNVLGFEGELSEFGKLVSSAVGLCLAEASESRREIAEELSSVLDERITPQMLDAYASPARTGHGINAHRFLALLALTRRYDILDAVVRQVGAKAIDENDSKIFEIGKEFVRKTLVDRSVEEKLTDLLGRS